MSLGVWLRSASAGAAVPRRSGVTERALLGVSGVLAMVTIGLIVTSGDVAILALKEWRIGRNLGLSLCFLAAALLVLTNGVAGRPLARTLLVISSGMGLFAATLSAGASGELLSAGTQAVLETAGVYCIHGGLAVLPLWFPAGHRPPRGWHLVIAGMAVVYIAYLTPLAWYAPRSGDPNWTNNMVDAHISWWSEAGTGVIVWMPRTIAVAVLVTVVLRWRRGTGLLRRQLAVMGACHSVYWGIQIYDMVWQLFTKAAAPQPVYLLMLGPASAALGLGTAVATTVPVTRAGLNGLDRVLPLTLVGLGLVLGLYYTYRGVFAMLSALLGRTPPTTAAAVASGVAVLALRPVGGVLVRGVDRVLYGRRAKPYEVLRALSRSLSRRMPADEVAHTVCTTLVERLSVPAVVLQALTRHGPRELACAGSSATGGSVAHIALDHQGEAVGTLTLHLRAGQRTLDAADRTMLELLGDQLGPLVHGIGLREQLRLSREQIVAAREEERRRLRRDLHDGLGPTLAGIRLRLDTAAAAMVDDSPRKMVEAACADAAHSLTEVRRLTHGLRPPDLDRGGLVGALRCLRNRLDPTGVCVDARLPDLVPDLSAACEVAAYRIAAEALTNVVRHAKAHTVVLCLAVVGNDVTLEITDDGIGLSPAAGRGVGLGSMKERAEEIGGTLTVASGSHGTVVRAVLPIQGQ